MEGMGWDGFKVELEVEMEAGFEFRDLAKAKAFKVT